MMAPARPTQRDEFYIAIICALSREADAVTLLFDQFWDEDGDTYGRALGDTNVYTTGCIGRHNVVLFTLPNMGTTSAASAAAALRSSYHNLRLTLLVGICGGVPRISGHDTFLGDVIISKSVIQYDYGRQYPGGFVVRNAIDDILGRANRDIRGLLTHLETERGREKLQEKSALHLEKLQELATRKRRRANYQRPDGSQDGLFAPDYIHKHRVGCDVCAAEASAACDLATKASCNELGCDEANKVARNRTSHDVEYAPEIFIGRIGSGNQVMKSGTDRDRIAAEHDIVAFEMEGAGVWDEVPCIVVKGICDFADSHKNKRWQDFAAATAAAVTKGVIEQYVLDDSISKGPGGLPSPNARGTSGGSRTMSNNYIGEGSWINQGDIHGGSWSR